MMLGQRRQLHTAGLVLGRVDKATVSAEKNTALQASLSRLYAYLNAVLVQCNFFSVFKVFIEQELDMGLLPWLDCY